MATINDLRTKANLVANATAVGENTAGRVGGALQDAADLIAQLLDSVNINKGADGTRDERITSLQNTLVNLQKALQDESTNRSAKDEALQELITTLQNSKGEPDGIAPLDRKGKVPAAHLPSYVDDVIEFDGCMDNLTVQQTGVDMLSTDEHAKVIYNRAVNVFVLAVQETEDENTIFYASWPDQETYGDMGRNGITPVSGKVYVDTSTNITYRWSGTKLVIIGTDLALGYTAEAAFPGNEGAELKQRYIRDVEILNEDLTDTAQTIREMQSAISTNTTSLNDLTTRVGSMETNSTRMAAVMAAVKTSVEEAKASAEAAKTAVEGVKASSTTTDGKTLEDVYTIAMDAANRESAPRVEVVQATGDSEEKVMSQKAVTKELKAVTESLDALDEAYGKIVELKNHPNTHHVLSQTEKNRITWATYLTNKDNSSVFLQVALGGDGQEKEHLRLACNIADQSDRIRGILCLQGNIFREGIENIGNKKPIFTSISPYDRTSEALSGDNGYRKFVKPLVDKGIFQHKEFYVENECYYYAFLNDYNSIFVLNPYDNDDLAENEYWEPVDYNESYPKIDYNHEYTYDENTPVFVNLFSYTKHSLRLKKTVTTGWGSYSSNDNTIPRLRTGNHICFSQKQLEWLCKLLEMGRLSSFMIAAPAPLCQGMTQVKGKFSHEPERNYSLEQTFPTAMETDVIKEIMKAFKESRQLNLKVRYKEDGPAAYLNTQTDEEGRKYAFTLSYEFHSHGNEFKGFLGDMIFNFKEGTILRDNDSGFYSIHPPVSYYEIDGHQFDDFRFNVVGLRPIEVYDGDGPDPTLCRIARIGYDLNEDGSVDDVLELKKD